MKEIHLFVQEGCRPCLYAETQLKKVAGWDNVVTITPAKVDGVWSEFAQKCGVEATPTLIALIDGNIVAKMSGSQDMTSTFWQATINNHKKGEN
jgi:thioredoxin-like negative regulator of GroEL